NHTPPRHTDDDCGYFPGRWSAAPVPIPARGAGHDGAPSFGIVLTCRAPLSAGCRAVVKATAIRTFIGKPVNECLQLVIVHACEFLIRVERRQVRIRPL